jgi:hypothetical protein
MAMSVFSSDEHARGAVRGIQILVGALMAGMLTFAGIAIVTNLSGDKPRQKNSEVLVYLATGATVVALVVRVVVSSIMTKTLRRKIAAGTTPDALLPADATDADRLLWAYRQILVFEGALCEGPGFFVLVAFIVTGQWWLLAVVAILLGLLAMLIPTFDRAEDWVKDQLEWLELEKLRS